ncbi:MULTISPECIES: HAMP domain-containing sensor histidine kinase [unclassified Pseudofrankia]|uniref:sensor histidine kinase n=1 Tax=unclassified Pseudofrankia TaxID=2994372 RepID=UPI0008DA7054|nr:MULTISPECIES: HAMP domain-containing sensor histidine kinase [unclassified Pseudofrankia]MDT3443752.1 HAMP domain-containing sensor histidine kinase [Pseudofrankia sp. BMG5.37]OHV50027.1 two-component sensor histidine kinase [Pseudofrankia sp. BMG5.36]
MSAAGPPFGERARRRHERARAARTKHVGVRSERPAAERHRQAEKPSQTDAHSRAGRAGGWVASLVPHGHRLPFEDWTARHRLLKWILALHLPAIVGYALLRDFSLTHGLAAASPSLLLFGAAALPGARRVRALAASLGLLCCSVVLVHLSDGLGPMYFHFFVVVALIALYEDWSVYVLAIGFVFISNLVLRYLVSPGALTDNARHSALMLAAMHAGFIVALACAQVVFWHYNQKERRRTERYRHQLYEGQQSLMARLEETEKIRTDLVATVSHEFRTPLAGIRGNLLTIRRRRHRMSDEQLDVMLDSALNSSERLSRLLENMLTAATATGIDDNTVSDLPEVVHEALGSLRHASMAGAVAVDLPEHLPVRMSRQALHQVVANLVDNALVHSWPGTPVRLIAGRVGDEVVLRVRNQGPDLDKETIDRLFEPFTQRDGSATRSIDGAGMGLYVVRRLVEVHGGRLRMTADGGEINVEVDMWAAELSLPTNDPTHLPNMPDLPGLRPERLAQDYPHDEPALAPTPPLAGQRPPRWDWPSHGPIPADAPAPGRIALDGGGGPGHSAPLGRRVASSWRTPDDFPLDRSG